jgi:ATP/maltotriose-dependent transcriptional regulator MalT
MAGVALATGDASEAERLLDEAMSVLRHAGRWFSSLALCVRAILAVRRGNPDEAIAFVRQSLTDIRKLHDAFAFVNLLVPLATAAVLKGDDAWAARILGVRDVVTERTGARVVDKAVHDLKDQAERQVRARLGDAQWNRAYAAGRVTSIDSLVKDIDRILETATGS